MNPTATSKTYSSNNLSIIWQLVKGDFMLRYQNSYLGYLWTLFKPLLLFGVIYLVFSEFLKSPMQNYSIYLLLGIVIWTFFSEATLVGMNSLISKRDLITKIYFRRENIIIASVISSLITLGLNLIIFAVFMFSAGLLPGINSIVFLFYLPLLFLFTCGVTFFLATQYARFHDLGHIWEVLLQIFFWLTPIVYDLSFVPEQYRQLLYLNPLTQFISYSRKIFLINELPSLKQHLILIVISILSYLIGYYYFKRREHYIAETI